MVKYILCAAMMAVIIPSIAQETRIEKTNHTTEALDSKENSEAVPKAYGIRGDFKEIVVARVKFKTDMLEGLEQVVREYGIENAVILSGAGSVRGYHVHQVINRDFPSKNMYVKNPVAPADLISANGYVINGRIHCHITLADPDKSFGGHLEYGTEVFTFAIITFGVLEDDVNLENVDNKHYR